jgi:hypothetical protein
MSPVFHAEEGQCRSRRETPALELHDRLAQGAGCHRGRAGIAEGPHACPKGLRHGFGVVQKWLRRAQPIYVGKAIPKGGRKGGLSTDAAKGGNALADRLRQHAASIAEATNLTLSDFHVRHLIVDDIWIPLGENMLIETFKPVWNRAIDGFGNKDPGNRRASQYKSPWDVLHPGRAFAAKLADSGMTSAFLEQRVADYLAGRPLARLPRVVAVEQAVQEAEAEDNADQV